MKIHRGIIKATRSLALSVSPRFSPIRVDNKASAAFLIREWNGGVACERAPRIIYFPRKRQRRSNFRIR